MAFIFTCGTHSKFYSGRAPTYRPGFAQQQHPQVSTNPRALESSAFKSLLEGYENITVQCQNCGNFSGKITKQWQWFTFCFVPLIPFSLKPYQDVSCHICHFNQDVKYRPDVEAQMRETTGGSSATAIPLQNQTGPGQNAPPPPTTTTKEGAPQQYQ
nr:hypothetical protein CFP56_54365 [Quercus suber]